MAHRDQLAAISEQCKLSPYFLRMGTRKRVTIHVPPNVRARPLQQSQIDCVRAQLKTIGAELATGPPTPETKAELQALLDGIHRDCRLGPYELIAVSAASAYITISPTIRVDPLTELQHHCVKTYIEHIPGVTLLPGIVPTAG